METAKKIVKLLFAVTLLWMLLYIVTNIWAAFNTFTSFPWWSAFVFAGYYFGPALLLEGLVYAALLFMRKRKQV